MCSNFVYTWPFAILKTLLESSLQDLALACQNRSSLYRHAAKTGHPADPSPLPEIQGFATTSSPACLGLLLPDQDAAAKFDSPAAKYMRLRSFCDQEHKIWPRECRDMAI